MNNRRAYSSFLEAVWKLLLRRRRIKKVARRGTSGSAGPPRARTGGAPESAAPPARGCVRRVSQTFHVWLPSPGRSAAKRVSKQLLNSSFFILLKESASHEL